METIPFNGMARAGPVGLALLLAALVAVALYLILRRSPFRFPTQYFD